MNKHHTSRRRKKGQNQQDFLFEIVKDIAKQDQSHWTRQDRETLVRLLQETRFFKKNLDSQLSYKDFLELLQEYVSVNHFKKGETIIIDGQAPEQFHFILEGQVIKFATKTLKELEIESEEISKAQGSNSPKSQFGKSGFLDGKALKTTIFIGKLKKAGEKRMIKKAEEELKKKQKKKLYTAIKSKKTEGGEEANTQNSKKRRGDRKRSTAVSGNVDSVDMRDKKLSKSSFSLKGPKLKGLTNIKDDLYDSNASGKDSDYSAISETENSQNGSEFGGESDRSAYDEEEAQRALVEQMMREKYEDEKLVDLAIKMNPSLATKFYWINVVKFKRVKPVNEKEYFGEGFARQNRPTQTTIIASQDTTTITISRTHYFDIINTLIGRMHSKVEFFKDLFNGFEESVVAKFAFYFGEVRFERGDAMYQEGDAVNHLLLLRSGDVKLSKFVTLPNERKIREKLDKLLINQPKDEFKVKLPIARVPENHFFGEEMILKEDKRLFSAVAGSYGAVCFFLEISVYHQIKLEFREIFALLKKQANDRLLWRAQRLDELIENKELVDLQNSSKNKHSSCKIATSQIYLNKISKIEPLPSSSIKSPPPPIKQIQSNQSISKYQFPQQSGKKIQTSSLIEEEEEEETGPTAAAAFLNQQEKSQLPLPRTNPNLSTSNNNLPQRISSVPNIKHGAKQFKS